jgi:diacylglycerol kinase family enzyme
VVPLPVVADGEIVFEEAHRLEVEVLPGALRVLS